MGELECNLKIVMIKKRIRQKELTELTGLSRKTLSFIANERSEPNISTCLIIAEALKVSVHDIWTLKKPSQD